VSKATVVASAGGSGPDQHSDGGQAGRLPNDARLQIARRCAKRHANANFLRPLLFHSMSETRIAVFCDKVFPEALLITTAVRL